MGKKTDNKDMKVTGGEYLTVADMSKMLGIPIETVKKRLMAREIKPLARDALYPISALDAIKNTVMGRPKKAPENTAEKKPPVETKKKPAAKKHL